MRTGASSFLSMVPVWETASGTLRSRRRVGVGNRERGLTIQLYPSHAVGTEDTYLTSLGHL